MERKYFVTRLVEGHLTRFEEKIKRSSTEDLVRKEQSYHVLREIFLGFGAAVGISTLIALTGLLLGDTDKQQAGALTSGIFLGGVTAESMAIRGLIQIAELKKLADEMARRGLKSSS